MPEPVSRIPSLDGLRAIAIGIVVLGHWQASDGFPISQAVVQQCYPFGARLGVCLFFVISGYLITTLLLSEKDRFGSLSLRLFYTRRSLRIFPPFYCFMLFVAGLWSFGLVDVSAGSFVSASLYFRNFYPGNENILGHVWSLSIEEQFYLLWPLFLARLRPRGCLGAASALILLRPLVRMLRHGYLLPPNGVEALADSGMEVILYGALLALLMHDAVGSRVARESCRGYAGLIIPIVWLWLCYYWARAVPDSLTWAFQQTRDLMITWCLLWCVLNAQTPIGRFLNWKPIVWVGMLSYSLYLWQQPFLLCFHGWAFTFPQNLVFAAGVACASYYLIEQPFTRLRARFSRSIQETRKA